MASPFGPATETTVVEPDAGERAQTAAELWRLKDLERPEEMNLHCGHSTPG